ncbi:hypothetical protein OC845_005799 [Tilletia horrida]|nr:hypothetical protein OC845_005799 [Tilletia horrida]
MLFHLERHSPGHNAVDELAAGLMDLSAVRDLFLSPAVATTTAAAISSFVIGYYAGVGRSLFAYNADSRRRLVADTDDDEEEDDDALLDDNMGRSRVAAAFMEECKMVFVVRTDLKMDKGKIAAQCGCVGLFIDFLPVTWTLLLARAEHAPDLFASFLNQACDIISLQGCVTAYSSGGCRPSKLNYSASLV